FFFQAEDGIRDPLVTGVQTCALPICICAHSVVLRALGAAGADLVKAHPEDWKSKLNAIEAIDWSKSNKDWENVCIIANSVVSNRSEERRVGKECSAGVCREVITRHRE